MGRKSKTEWQELLEDFEARQVGQEEYCRERGLSLSAFRKQLYAWRRSRGLAVESSASDEHEFVMVASGWPVIERAEAVGKAVLLTLGGFSLTVERSSDPEALRLALRAVAETCGRI
jgi:hypothetical protein